MEVHLDDFYVVRIIVGQFSNQHLVEQHTQGINIGRGSNNASRLLRSHVVRCPRYLIQGNRLSSLFYTGLLRIAHQPKISKIGIRRAAATSL